MFAGEFKHTIDEKNRLVIPAKFRTFITDEGDRKGFFILASPIQTEHCLRLYTLHDQVNVFYSRVATERCSAARSRCQPRPPFRQQACVVPPRHRRLFPGPLRRSRTTRGCQLFRAECICQRR